MSLVAAVLAAVSIAGTAADSFRYERPLPDVAATGQAAFEPDGAMLAHTRAGFADLRIIDADGERVAWRERPADEASSGRRATVLSSGFQGSSASALIDTGSPRATYERVELDISGRDFTGRVSAEVADRRDGPYTAVSTTRVYDVSGATNARSTTIVLPPTDARYVRVRGEGIGRIRGATVLGEFERPQLVHRPARPTRPPFNGKRRTVLTLDLGHAKTPISEVELTAGGSGPYDRPVTVSGSNDGQVFFPIASGRITRAPGIERRSISVDSTYRYVRAEIGNGDDTPLRSVDAQLYGPSRALMVEPGHPQPVTMYYGAAIPAPDYEFARLPVDVPARVLPLAAGQPERPNPAFSAQAKPQSFGDRNGWIVTAALVLAAAVVAMSGVVVMRRNS